MTEKLYDKDSHLKEFWAKVLSCEKDGENYAVILDKTAFFPEGGGQESDRGNIGGAAVLDVQIADDEIIHYTDRPLNIGEEYGNTRITERLSQNLQGDGFTGTGSTGDQAVTVGHGRFQINGAFAGGEPDLMLFGQIHKKASLLINSIE